jgi:hypothetical protein
MNILNAIQSLWSVDRPQAFQQSAVADRNTTLVSLEIVWWIVTALVAVIILFPMWYLLPSWPFNASNVLFIAVLITFSRYLFLLEHTFLAKRQVLKFIIFILLFPITFALIGQLNAFMIYIEEKTWEPLTGHLLPRTRRSIEGYAYGQMMFFATGSVVAAPLLAIKLISSIWRTHNSV